MNLINTCSECSADWPCLSPSSQVSLFPKTQNTEIRPINEPTMGSKCSSLILNKKLEMIKLSEGGMLKAEIGRKLGRPLVPKLVKL